MKIVDVHKYRVEVRPLSEEDGGGYVAHFPQFGEGIHGISESPQDAMTVLYDNLEEIIAIETREGRSWPAPEETNENS